MYLFLSRSRWVAHDADVLGMTGQRETGVTLGLVHVKIRVLRVPF